MQIFYIKGYHAFSVYVCNLLYCKDTYLYFDRADQDTISDTLVSSDGEEQATEKVCNNSFNQHDVIKY